LHSADYVVDGIPVVNPTNIVDGRVVPDMNCTINVGSSRRLAAYSLRANDIVLGRRGEMGRVALISKEQNGWLCGTGSMRIRISDLAVPEFVARIIGTRGSREWLSLNSVGSTMQNLNPAIVGGLPVPLPPLEQQREILRNISSQEWQSRKIEDAIGRAEERIREYRSALITASVTGQIDMTGPRSEAVS
jgi:type I restriction enzyme, S subunit